MSALGTFEVVVAVVAGAGILLAAALKAWQLLRRIVRFFDVLAVIESRTEQLEHNGGTSIKDAVTRIEKTLDDHIAQCPPPRRRWPLS